MHMQNRAICTGLQGENRDIVPWRTPRLIAGDGAELLKMTVHHGLVKVFRAWLPPAGNQFAIKARNNWFP